MADTEKMDRTWLCSVLFMDIVNYSSQSVELQMKWKKRFNGYLSESIRDVPEADRVILDTGDGAAVCFLGAPEVAMFAALELSRAFAVDARENEQGLCVRLGINLGPVKLVRDINGALNAIGDGINAGQRIMSFASDNKILVSQSFFEVVSRLSDDYKGMFRLKGVETDKHVREHTVYHLMPPGSEKREPMVANSAGIVASSSTPTAPAAEEAKPAAAKRQWVPWLFAGAAVAALAAVGVSHFRGSSMPVAASAASTTQAATGTAIAGSAAASTVPSPVPVAAPTATDAKGKTLVAQAASPRSADPVAEAPPSPATAQPRRAGRPAAADSVPVSPAAKSAYDDGMRLIGEDKAAEAAHRFDEAVQAAPDYVDAYLGRAEARRILLQFPLSIQDCSKAIELSPSDSRGYNCRGFAHQMAKQPEAAIPDYNEAIRLNPNFVGAYEHRGTTYELLQQYDRAVEDYTKAIALAPRNPMFYVRRGTAYSSLKQYDKAIHDFTEALRMQPENKNAYRLRAQAEQASGDAAGAAADRERMRESPKAKMKNQ